MRVMWRIPVQFGGAWLQVAREVIEKGGEVIEKVLLTKKVCGRWMVQWSVYD